MKQDKILFSIDEILRIVICTFHIAYLIEIILIGFFLWICYKQKLNLRRTDAQGQPARASLSNLFYPTHNVSMVDSHWYCKAHALPIWSSVSWDASKAPVKVALDFAGSCWGVLTEPTSYSIQNHIVENSTSWTGKDIGKEGKTSPETSGSTKLFMGIKGDVLLAPWSPWRKFGRAMLWLNNFLSLCRRYWTSRFWETARCFFVTTPRWVVKNSLFC